MRSFWAAAMVAAAMMQVASAAQPSGGSDRSALPMVPMSLQLAQSCVCHNPVGAVGETFCRSQRVVRCRANTRNQCGWDVTNERC